MIRPEVLKGAEALDSILPTWELRIDLRKLDLQDCAFCILGNLLNYSDSVEICTQNRPVLLKLGLILPLESSKESYQKLTQEWIELICQRKSKALAYREIEEALRVYSKKQEENNDPNL